MGQAAQTISVNATATGIAGKTVTLTATGGGSGNPVTFTTDPASGAGVCTVSGDTVSYTAADSASSMPTRPATPTTAPPRRSP